MSTDCRTRLNNGTAWIARAAGVLLGVAVTGTVQAQEFSMDPPHSRIGFAVTHLGISTVKGQFTNYTAKLSFLKDNTNAITAEAIIQVKSIDTAWAARDTHLRTPDFFNAEAFPEIRFKTEGLRKAGEPNAWVLKGTFTMHGVTKEMTLPCTINGPIKDPWGNQRIGFQARTVLNRHDYGVGNDKVTDKAIGEEVTIEIEAEAVATGK